LINLMLVNFLIYYMSTFLQVFIICPNKVLEYWSFSNFKFCKLCFLCDGVNLYNFELNWKFLIKINY